MSDVAKRAGVALSTVSYALSGTRPISLETQKRIFNAMEELGYSPNFLARGLASKRSRIIALLFPPSERGLGITELEFVTSAADAAKEYGYHLVLWSSKISSRNELRGLIQQGLVDGVVLMEVHLQDERVKFLREVGFPFSIIGRCEDNSGIDYTDIDFEQTMREAVNYLRDLGHSNIAFLNHSQAEFDAGYGPAVRAQASFEQVMSSAGLESITRFCRATPQAGFEGLAHLLIKHADLTALVIMNDRALAGVMQAVVDHGWEIPADFSIVSIVSSDRVAEMMVPSLTTMDSPSAELGCLGVELLIQKLESKRKEYPQILLPCRLVVRGSTGPCRRDSAT